MAQAVNTQLRYSTGGIQPSLSNGTMNRLAVDDRPVHNWYRFVLSFPPHLVRDYLSQFHVGPGQVALDPFCGTGTALVECKKLGIESIGIEAHPMAHVAAQVKTDWAPEPKRLIDDATGLARLAAQRIEDPDWHPKPLPEESSRLLIGGSISSRPLHKTLVLRDTILQNGDPDFRQHHLLALASALPTGIGNLQLRPGSGSQGDQRGRSGHLLLDGPRGRNGG